MGSYNGKWIASYNGMLVREFKAELEGRKLSTVGVRSRLIKRLVEDDESGYNLLTVRELKIRMEEQGLDISGNKKVLKNRMKSTLINRGYKFLPTNDLRQLCSEKGLVTTGHKSTLVTRLSNADAAKVTTVSSGSSHNPYSGVTSSTSYAQSLSGDSTPVVMTVIGGVIAFMLVLGCISMLDTEEEDSYSSSSSSSSGSSTPCEQLKDVWCYSYSLDMCVYHDSSSNTVYYQEAHWYGC